MGSNPTFAAPAIFAPFSRLRPSVNPPHMTRALTLTLALLIAVTSQHMAMARAVMVDDAGQVVLCTTQGTITVTLGVDGTPQDGHAFSHFCPECMLTFAVLSGGPHRPQPALIHIDTLGYLTVGIAQNTLIPTRALPRGPPAMV